MIPPPRSRLLQFEKEKLNENERDSRNERGVATRRIGGRLCGMNTTLRLSQVTACVVTAVCALVCLSVNAEGKGGPQGSAKTSVTHANAKQAAGLVAEKKVTVLDIRTPREFAAGHIPGATNIDSYASDFAQKLDALDRTKSYLVHCASGGRSIRSLEQFRKLGFKSIIHLDSGFKGWEKAGNPVEKSPE
jgi:phage shock protein E